MEIRKYVTQPNLCKVNEKKFILCTNHIDLKKKIN